MRNGWLRAYARLAALALAAGGCTTASSRYYFAAADLDDTENAKLTFYRLTVTGRACAVKTSYQSGFYNARALHELYGKVQDPGTQSQEDSHLGQFTVAIDPATGRLMKVDDTTRFTLIYGANADAIAQQVQMFADSDDAGKQIGSMLAVAAGSSTLVDATAAEDRAKKAKSSTSDVAKAMDSTQGQLKDDQTADAARKELLSAAQAAMKALGSSKTYDPKDPDQAFADIKTDIDALAPAK